MTLPALMSLLTMRNAPTIPTATWYADGVHWIGSLFESTDTQFDRPSFAPSAEQPRAEYLAAEEFLFDVRTRMLSHL